KVRDLFNPTNQVCIKSEVIDSRDDGPAGKGKADIHDFKTLYEALQPGIADFPYVLQSYIWWDLPDAADLARFQFRLARYKDLAANTTPEAQKFYRNLMGRGEEGALPTQEEILDYECRTARDSLDAFAERRRSEKGYRLILS